MPQLWRLLPYAPLSADEVGRARWSSMKCGRRSPATTSERTRQWTPPEPRLTELWYGRSLGLILCTGVCAIQVPFHLLGVKGARDGRAAELRDRYRAGTFPGDGRAGIPSLIEVFRLTGAAAAVDRSVKVKARKRGLSASEMTESFFALWAAAASTPRTSISCARTRLWPR